MVVPGHLRMDRRREWEAELWQLCTGGGSRADLAHFVVGAWLDAIWERKEGWRMELLMLMTLFILQEPLLLIKNGHQPEERSYMTAESDQRI